MDHPRPRGAALERRRLRAGVEVHIGHGYGSPDQWITTSFNWLSFNGDPNRTYRMEEGALVLIKSEVDKAFARFIDVIDADGVDPRERV